MIKLKMYNYLPSNYIQVQNIISKTTFNSITKKNHFQGSKPCQFPLLLQSNAKNMSAWRRRSHRARARLISSPRLCPVLSCSYSYHRRRLSPPPLLPDCCIQFAESRIDSHFFRSSGSNDDSITYLAMRLRALVSLIAARACRRIHAEVDEIFSWTFFSISLSLDRREITGVYGESL